MIIYSKNYCCIECGNLISESTALYGKGRCRKCYGKAHCGINNVSFIDGRTTTNHYCIDCGIKISIPTALRGLKRCKSCSHKGDKNYNFKDIKNKCFCKKCGNSISLTGFYGKGLCFKCFLKIKPKGKNSPRYIDRIKIPCFECKKIIERTPKKIVKHNFCNKICYGKWHSRTFTGKNNPHFGKLAAHSKHIKYFKTYFRSLWEANFAKWCYSSGIKWRYEPKAFNLTTFTYRPDFYLPQFNCWIEIKGWWRGDAKEKVEKFIKTYPDINFRIYFKEDLQELGIIK